MNKNLQAKAPLDYLAFAVKDINSLNHISDETQSPLVKKQKEDNALLFRRNNLVQPGQNKPSSYNFEREM